MEIFILINSDGDIYFLFRKIVNGTEFKTVMVTVR